MKLINCLLLVFLLMSACTSKTDNSIQEIVEAQEEVIEKKLRHVVLFNFKETATAENIEKIEIAFAALPSKIKEIKDFEWGLNNSPEGLDKDFTHCFLVTFESESGRDIYLPHEAHQAFVELLKPELEDVLVFDYWAK